MRFLVNHPLLGKIFDPIIGADPAARFIRSTARKQWRLITLNIAASLVEAFSEGATLGVVFLAVEVISAPDGRIFAESLNSFLAWSPFLLEWINGMHAAPIFIALLCIALSLQGLQSVTSYINLLSAGYFSARCRALVTARIHSQVLSLSFPCSSGYKVGDLTDNASQGPLAISIVIDQISKLFVTSCLIIAYLVVLVGISPWLLIAVLLVGGSIALLQKQLLPLIRFGSHSLSKAQVEISSRITENFQGLRLLHTSGQIDEADQKLRARMGDYELLLRAQTRRLSVLNPVASFLPILAISLIAALSFLLLGSRSSGVLPSLVTFVLALQRLNVRFSKLADSANLLANNSGRLNRLNQILSRRGKQFRHQGGKFFTSLEHSIRFEQVSLCYSYSLPPSLCDISFTLPKGGMLALVGPSGAGKSSIADLLTGLYQSTSGNIFIDDMPLDQLNLISWQQRLGVVSQDTFLFNATIAENVAFGTLDATIERIETACHAAQASEFIKTLPEGYDTLVGERGYRLSGGQRQRLSLARAILRDPELLILDEATSALDSQSERLVQEAIERFEQNHTMLVIAHRLSTITGADQILVLDSGRIVERGTHNSLLSLQGLYWKLWLQQTQSI